MALIDGCLSAGEYNETEEEKNDSQVDELATLSSDDSTDIEPDFDDICWYC